MIYQCERVSFSRRPACYNTDTEPEHTQRAFFDVSVEDLPVIILILNNRELLEQYIIVSVEDLHVIILIQIMSGIAERGARVSVEDLHVIILILKNMDKERISFHKFQSKTCML